MDQTRLLVIEDDPDIRALLGEFLGREGYEVRALETGRLATQTIAGFAPALQRRSGDRHLGTIPL